MDEQEELEYTEDIMLTTKDNPFDPFTQFDAWYAYDVSLGYNTCSYFARIAITSSNLSPKEQDDSLNEAIDEIIKFDPFKNYKKVTKKILKT